MILKKIFGLIIISVMTNKTCKKCDEEKSVDDFYFRKRTNTYEGVCRKCNAAEARERRQNNKELKDNQKNRYQTYYNKNKERLNKNSQRYYKKNKKNIAEQQKSYYQKNKTHLKQKAKIRREYIKKQVEDGKLTKPNIENKICTNCKVQKNILEFGFRKTRNIYNSTCKRCDMLRERKRRELHKEKINRRRREITKPLTPKQRIATNLRKRVNRIITKRDGKNLYKKLLGCDRLLLYKWFEYNFEKDKHLGMNWDNYGTYWSIEHVRPCASFDLTNKDEQQVCFHWTNTCPVPISYNASKCAKIIPEDEKKQISRIDSFLRTIDKNKYKYSILNS